MTSRNLSIGLLTGFLVALASQVLAQKAFDLSGNWMVASISLKGGAEIGITEQNCTWCGHYKTSVPMIIDKDNAISYQFEGEAKSAKATISGNKMKVNFLSSPSLTTDGPNEIYTEYEFRSEVSGFMISRQDPAIKEEYHFKRTP